ncbi:MAG: FeoB-associated Cys-rich membrane protein [Candidatus Cloacimonetes bacterium]|nr:FeoB-associated Cys-rich membrane protein [Candidatus Cloacimonadota bacterium]
MLDLIIVSVIVLLALLFVIRSFVRISNGKESCCGSCSSCSLSKGGEYKDCYENFRKYLEEKKTESDS